MVWYNDNNAYACRVLRARVLDRSLPMGDVDERNIEEIEPEEVAHYRQWHLFAGIGGFPLGLTSESSPADSLARTSATQDYAQELAARAAACGERWQDSFAFCDLKSLSWKTLQLCFTGEWSEYSETWPRAGTMRNGIAFQRRPLAPLTCVTEFSSLPTPRAIYGEHPGMRDKNHLTGHALDYQKPLPNETSNAYWERMDKYESQHGKPPTILWPTPQRHDATGGRGKNNLFADNHHYPHDLVDAVKMWPTPNEADSKRAGNFGRGEGNPTLAEAAKLFRSPSSRDWKGQSAESWRLRTSGDTTPTLPDQVGGQLNPTWVEWLMGYPIGWVNLPDSVTRSSRKSRNLSASASAKNSAGDCPHERTDEDGICKACGHDCRGIG